MRAVKNNLPTPSGEVGESEEGPRPIRAVGDPSRPATGMVVDDHTLRPWRERSAHQVTFSEVSLPRSLEISRNCSRAASRSSTISNWEWFLTPLFPPFSLLDR